MINELKAEVRKVFSVRSTYWILFLIVVLVVFFCFYVGGWHTDSTDLLNHHQLYRVDQQAVGFISIFPALMGILLLTHEFRYNTIFYSLTLSNNRNKVLAAKILVISTLALVIATIVSIASPLLANLGLHAHHLKLAHQTFPYASMAWHGLVFAWGEAMAALVIATIIRNQIGSLITFFIIPDTVEGLLSILLKKNTVYLPFSALHSIIGVGVDSSSGNITPLHATYVFLGYLIVAWAVAWTLFLRRDVN